MITELGPVKFFTKERRKEKSLINIIEKIKLSLEKHKSVYIVIVAHSDCAGNPVSKEIQIEQLKYSIRELDSLFKTIHVSGLWIDKNWEVFPISKMKD